MILLLVEPPVFLFCSPLSELPATALNEQTTHPRAVPEKLLESLKNPWSRSPIFRKIEFGWLFSASHMIPCAEQLGALQSDFQVYGCMCVWALLEHKLIWFWAEKFRRYPPPYQNLMIFGRKFIRKFWIFCRVCCTYQPQNEPLNSGFRGETQFFVQFSKIWQFLWKFEFSWIRAFRKV